MLFSTHLLASNEMVGIPEIQFGENLGIAKRLGLRVYEGKWIFTLNGDVVQSTKVYTLV